MNKDPLYWTVILGVLITLFTIGVLGTIERQKWLNAHCEVVEEISGTTGTGVGMVGNKIGYITTYEYGKKVYECEDGIRRTE